jgi:hypothetical protein
VTTVLEEAKRKVFVKEHALAGVLKHNSCSQKMLVSEALKWSRNSETKKLQVLKKLKKRNGSCEFLQLVLRRSIGFYKPSSEKQCSEAPSASEGTRF